MNFWGISMNTFLRQCSKGSHLATSVGGFRVVGYSPVTDKVSIVWDWSKYGDVCSMDGGSLLSFMSHPDCESLPWVLGGTKEEKATWR